MAHEQAGIIHVNVTDFAASVAIRKDPSLAGRPFVLARQGSARPIVIAVSPKARQEGLYGGMSLATAIRMVPSLTIVGPDASAHAKADAALAEIASQYSPAIQADPGGHLLHDGHAPFWPPATRRAHPHRIHECWHGRRARCPTKWCVVGPAIARAHHACVPRTQESRCCRS